MDIDLCVSVNKEINLELCSFVQLMFYNMNRRLEEESISKLCG